MPKCGASESTSSSGRDELADGANVDRKVLKADRCGDPAHLPMTDGASLARRSLGADRLPPDPANALRVDYAAEQGNSDRPAATIRTDKEESLVRLGALQTDIAVGAGKHGRLGRATRSRIPDTPVFWQSRQRYTRRAVNPRVSQSGWPGPFEEWPLSRRCAILLVVSNSWPGLGLDLDRTMAGSAGFHVEAVLEMCRVAKRQ